MKKFGLGGKGGSSGGIGGGIDATEILKLFGGNINISALLGLFGMGGSSANGPKDVEFSDDVQ